MTQVFKEQNIVPIIITQVEFNGLQDKTLFSVNELIKKIAEENNFYIIKLDELALMQKGDFYDKVHTTPQGSERISEVIYPYLKEILNNIN